jgi:hypothetical protein
MRSFNGCEAQRPCSKEGKGCGDCMGCAEGRRSSASSLQLAQWPTHGVASAGASGGVCPGGGAGSAVASPAGASPAVAAESRGSGPGSGLSLGLKQEQEGRGASHGQHGWRPSLAAAGLFYSSNPVGFWRWAVAPPNRTSWGTWPAPTPAALAIASALACISKKGFSGGGGGVCGCVCVGVWVCVCGCGCGGARGGRLCRREGCRRPRRPHPAGCPCQAPSRPC